MKFSVNPFVPNTLFIYPLKTSENGKVFWCFQEVEKGCIGNEWIKQRLVLGLDLIGAKKVVLFPEIGQVKIFLSPTRPHKSNVYENIYFLFQENTHIKKISTSKFICTNLSFFSLQTIKDRGLCFSKKKSTVKVVF